MYIYIYIYICYRNDAVTYNVAVHIYLHAGLHLFPVVQVITLIGDTAVERDLILYYVCALLSAYKARGAPRLLLSEGLDDCHGIVSRQSWDAVVRDALSVDRDEHIFKLVQVCRDMDDGNTDAELTRLYMTAASVALDYPLV